MIETAYFATGCFWGADRRFWQMPGVTETAVGYMGGHAESPTYEQVCTGSTGHAEMVKVVFDNQKITYRRLLEEFFTMHDPTSLNRQGGDVGSQYRSAVYYTNDNQREAIESGVKLYEAALAAEGHGPIVSEILSADGMTFWEAEEYHQRYLEKNPKGYDCHSQTGVPFPSDAWSEIKVSGAYPIEINEEELRPKIGAEFDFV
jgi:peptide-methionine (S)-S-oxide reductase